MIRLFSDGTLTILESLSFTRTLYAFDFDGTLARIVREPNDAYMNKTTEDLLKELARLVPVAIISGRSVADLKKRVDFEPEFLIGNHGLEGLTKRNGNLDEAFIVSKKWNDDLLQEEFISGVEVENKTYSIALHYRRARNKKIAKGQLLKSIEKLVPTPRVINGKCVYNLLPKSAPHKGAALLDLMRQSKFKHALYIGDDDTDEDVFGVNYLEGQIFTIRVGEKKSSQAKYFIEKQNDINKLLKILIRFHRSEPDRNRIKELVDAR